jgi:hypothetical protein
MAWAWLWSPFVEFTATLARGQGYTSIAGGLVVFDPGRVFFAESGVIGWLEPTNKLTSTIAETFVIVVTEDSLARRFKARSVICQSYHSKSCLVQEQFWPMLCNPSVLNPL